jgi:HAD superfamily hydrolase (TIGR01509 family)
MFKALLFDLDGTLADTDSVHLLAWAKVLEPHGYDVTRDFYQDKISGRSDPQIVSELLPNLSSEERRSVVEARDADFRKRIESLEPLSGLLNLIIKGREKGMKVSLVTNASRENVLAVLRVLGLNGAFDPVILADEVGPGKPDPAPYRAALETLGISTDEAVAFEDSPTGIASSVDAGIFTVGIASTHDPDTLEGSGVDLVARDFTDPKLMALIGER